VDARWSLGVFWARGAALCMLLAASACGGDIGRSSPDVSKARVERIMKSVCKRVLFCQREAERAAQDEETAPGEVVGYVDESDCLAQGNEAYMRQAAYSDECGDAYLDFAECSASSSCDPDDPACATLDRAIRRRCPEEARDEATPMLRAD
jgi:hypothetical protein